jgi:KRAB domain-containing zinc finger protein
MEEGSKLEPCKHCNESICSSSHIRTYSKQNKYQCMNLKKYVTRSSHLKTMAGLEVHTTENLYGCDQCGEAFQLSRRLKTHMLSYHRANYNKRMTEDITKEECVDNNKQVVKDISNDGNNVVEEAEELDIKETGNGRAGQPQSCNICGRSFKRGFSLKRHNLTHTGEKHNKCDVCDFSCNTTSSLKLHMLNHSGKRPYNCQQCAKSFKEAAKLRRHSMFHTGERRQKCQVCHYRCVEPSDLRKHLRVHSGEKPYKCSLCGQAFTQLPTLKRHMERVHDSRILPLWNV